MAAGEECGICLEALTNPVALPCSHKFCSACLDSWRPKHISTLSETAKKNTCPICRKKIPPSREMLTALTFYRKTKRVLEGRGDTSSEEYAMAKTYVEELELQVGDWTETIDYSGADKCLKLPVCVVKAASSIAKAGAARECDMQQILDWLGPPPVHTRRINATDPDRMDFTLLFYAVMSRNADFLSILLQFGADTNAESADGGTAMIQFGFWSQFYPQARLLLEWGANIVSPQKLDLSESMSKSVAIDALLSTGNATFANLLKSELGGRRCELVNLANRPDLNGKTCVVEGYLPNKDRYKIVFEGSGEKALVPPHNLKRRDRTPTDCGYYITFEKGRFIRRDFASKEECRAYVAELEAKHAAEQLAGLDIGSSKSESGKMGKKKAKKKAKKKRK